MTAMLEAGFIDTWRWQHPDTIQYSWWSYRMKARERNVGWRIDYFLVSGPQFGNSDLSPRIASTAIHDEIMGSDHCPVELALN